MKIIKTLLPFCAFIIISIVNADDGGETSSSTGRTIFVSENHTQRKTKTSSDHLGMLRTETALHILDTLRGNRYLRKLSDGGNFGLFTKSGKASASTKSDKATKSSKALGSKAKGQKVVQDDSTSLFTTCSDVQAKLDTCEAAATAPSWLFVQMADMCTLYHLP